MSLVPLSHDIFAKVCKLLKRLEIFSPPCPGRLGAAPLGTVPSHFYRLGLLVRSTICAIFVGRAKSVRPPRLFVKDHPLRVDFHRANSTPHLAVKDGVIAGPRFDLVLADHKLQRCDRSMGLGVVVVVDDRSGRLGVDTVSRVEFEIELGRLADRTWDTKAQGIGYVRTSERFPTLSSATTWTLFERLESTVSVTEALSVV